MISMKSKLFLQLISLMCIASLTLSLIVPVYATDSVDSLEQSSSNLEDELSGLQNEMKALGTEISSITKQIVKITEEIKETKEELAIAKGEEEVQYDSMKQRIRYMYENGSSNLLEILFSSASMADFLKKAEFVSMITEYDHEQLEELAKTKESIEQKETSLAEKQENLYKLQEDLNKKEASLSDKISSTSSELKKINKQLADAREEARRAEEALKEEIKPIPPKEEPAKPSIKDDTDDNNGNNSDIATSASDIELFAALLECEAGSRNYEAVLAVASVVVNRMNHPRYPDTIRGVIYQSGQFPPAHDGKVDRILKRGVKDLCVQAANDALAGKNNIGDCLSFRSASSGHVGTVIGDNVFF